MSSSTASSNSSTLPSSKAPALPQPSTTAGSIKSFLSGGFGGICLVAAGHPLDLIKVRLQTQSVTSAVNAAAGKLPPVIYTGMVDCMRKTVAREGFRGLYRGMAAPLIGVTPVFSVCFWGYDVGKRIAHASTGGVLGELSLPQIAFAGGFSALPTTVLMTPMERIKCVLQTSTQTTKVGPILVAKQIIRDGGIRSLFAGTPATLLRDGLGSVAYFVTYEWMKRTLSGEDKKALSVPAILCAGGFAGMANWLLAIPFDVLKSRQQTAAPGTYSGLRDVFLKTVRSEGPGALLQGLGPAMTRAFPANAACFMGVEVSLNVMNKLF